MKLIELLNRLLKINKLQAANLNTSKLWVLLDLENHPEIPKEFTPTVMHLVVCLDESSPMIDIRSDSFDLLESCFEDLVIRAESGDFDFHPIDIREGNINARSTD